jgi:hypothetical protein
LTAPGRFIFKAGIVNLFGKTFSKVKDYFPVELSAF